MPLSPMPATIEHTKPCVVCGKPFSPKENTNGGKRMARWNQQKACSRDCGSVAAGETKFLGDRVLDSRGYWRVYLPQHPQAMSGGRVYEHRWVIEQKLGRFLRPDEDVHHVNFDKTDNRPENLCVLPHGIHYALTSTKPTWN